MAFGDTYVFPDFLKPVLTTFLYKATDDFSHNHQVMSPICSPLSNLCGVQWERHSGENDALINVHACVHACVCPSSEFVQTILRFQSNLAQLFSLMSRCAIWRFHLGRSKVKVMWSWGVILGQPSSSLKNKKHWRKMRKTALHAFFSVYPLTYLYYRTKLNVLSVHGIGFKAWIVWYRVKAGWFGAGLKQGYLVQG